MLKIQLQRNTTVEFEHSLRSIAEWESLWCKPFLTREKKTPDEIYSYLEIMCFHRLSADDLKLYLSRDDVTNLLNYMKAPSTALFFKTEKHVGPEKKITAEYYYWLMFSAGVPLECENWHFERLVALLRYISRKQGKPTKVNKADKIRMHHKLNEERLKEMGWSNG